MFSRRDLGKAVLGSLPVAASAAGKIDSVVRGVQFGLQSYIFTGIGLPHETLVDTIIHSMVESGLGECDLYAPVVEPADFWDRIRSGPSGSAVPPEVAATRARAREELAAWRKTAPMDHFRAVRKKFEDAGISIHATSGFSGSTEEELRYTFDVASALGARLITLQIGMAAAKRIVPVAEKTGFTIGVQGHPDMHPADPDAISRPEEYDRALALSDEYRMSFDIGDAVGRGYEDVVRFVESHLDRIALIYLKDRRRDNVSMPWGQGDTPVAEVLRLVRDRKPSIRCYLDCDHKTSDRPADVKRSFEFAKAALG
jgi:sugar phosphate isomerase/epimerase